MNNGTLKNLAIVAFGCVVLASAGNARVLAQAEDAGLQELYDKWRKAVSSNPVLTEPMLFSTNAGIVDLTEAVSGMRHRQFEMAAFLCERFSGQPGINYFDANLLMAVARINLFHSETTPPQEQDIAKNIRTNFASFRIEWNKGIYKDPSRRIAELCDKRAAIEGEAQINPFDLLPISRYGLFGIPAMIDQVREKNSRHAFAALLLILGEHQAQESYLKASGESFRSKEAKVGKIRQAVEGMKSRQKYETDLLKRISTAIAL